MPSNPPQRHRERREKQLTDCKPKTKDNDVPLDFALGHRNFKTLAEEKADIAEKTTIYSRLPNLFPLRWIFFGTARSV